MAKAKDSFIMYYEWEDNLSELTDEQLGAFLRAVFAYERRGEPYSGADPEVKMAVRFVRGALDRNREKYARTCERNRKNGQKGGRPKNPEEPKEPSGFFGNPQEPKKADHEHEHEHEPDHDHDPEHEPEPEPDRDADSGGLAAAAAAEKRALDGFLALLRAETAIEPNARARESLLAWYRSYGSETVERLIHEASANGARKFGYLEAIMRRWERDGLTNAASQKRTPARRKKATGPEPEPRVASRRVSDAALEENRRQLEKLLADTAWMDKAGEQVDEYEQDAGETEETQ